jgi:hypothetical protein
MAPWYIIPADRKWFTRVAVADLIVERLKALGLAYPVVSEEQRSQLIEERKVLADEHDTNVSPSIEALPS